MGDMGQPEGTGQLYMFKLLQNHSAGEGAVVLVIADAEGEGEENEEAD